MGGGGGVPTGAAEVMEPIEIDFADLLLLSGSSSGVSSSLDREMERLDVLSDGVMEALGPSGPGLLCVTGVPGAPALRRELLPLARKLALLDKSDRARILKSHGLGSDVPLKDPHRAVSSFAKQLKYAEHAFDNLHPPKDNTVEKIKDLHGSEFDQLGDTFNLLALCMMEIGLLLARLCDRKIGGKELESSLLDSGTAKGRLIHYHSMSDHLIIKKQKERKKGLTMRPADFHASFLQEREKQNIKDTSTSYSADFWQQWHYDYGIFTVLTAPMLTMANDVNCSHHSASIRECSHSDWHTCLQLFDSTRNRIVTVKVPPDSFIVQMGESADILSKGKLRSTLHSVCRPSGLGSLCRETFVVFLQPAWDKILLTFDDGTTSRRHLGSTSRETKCGYHDEDSELESNINEEIIKAVPPLCSRLRDGMTFAEFSRETTKQYYGGGGTQSNR